MNMRYAIIGLGNMGEKRRDVLGMRCVATVDPDNAAADYKRIADLPAECYDAALLAVPNQMKLELLNGFLKIGKHVLIEKPLHFTDRDSANRLRVLAINSGVVWYTSYNHRFEPSIVRVKELLNEGIVGPVYHAHLIYGNGTVRNSIKTWRESGSGVLDDLGCHLIDLTDYLFDYSADYQLWAADRNESKVFDRCVFATGDRRIVLECATTMWRNRFSIDIYGGLGSLHLSGLSKWGSSELGIHHRILPSGIPHVTQESFDGKDLSWGSDFDEFERRANAGETSYASDWRISQSLLELARSVPSCTLRPS